jgi:hypothetical protein
VSHAAVTLLSRIPTYSPGCPWLAGCTRTLIDKGCSSCQFRFGSSDSGSLDGELSDPAPNLHLVAIRYAEAVR